MKNINLRRLVAYLFLTTTISMFALITRAQHIDKNGPFQLIRSERNNDVYTAINFIDTTTKQILSTFDLVENNPFNKLDYPELNKSSYGQPNNIYKLDGIPLNEINIPGSNLVLKSQLESSLLHTGLTGWNFYQASISGEYLVVEYSFYVNQGEMVLGRSDAVLIFNKNGEILHKLDGFDTNVREWALTENGRYFSYAYGSALDESLSYFSTVGYKIIDLEEDNIIFQEDFGFEFNEIRTRNTHNLIRITCFSLENKYIFIDFTKNKKYSRVFSREEKSLWKEITDTGILMYQGDRSSNTYNLLNFENDFKVEEIK